MAICKYRYLYYYFGSYLIVWRAKIFPFRQTILEFVANCSYHPQHLDKSLLCGIIEALGCVIWRRKVLNMDAELYEKDFYSWAMQNARLIRLGELSDVDLQNIAEELESMGKSEKRAFMNRLAVLIAHLLKWQFQPGMRSNSWMYSIKEQRASLQDLLEDSPSLGSEIEQKLEKAYSKAIIIAAKETGLPESTFPSTWPYSFSQTLDYNFLPE